MQENNKTKITDDDLKIIYGEDYELFRTKILPNCNCANCKTEPYSSTIVDYEIFLNDLNDVILQGHCDKCSGKISRYSETGEVEKYSTGIKKVKEKYEIR